VRYFVCRAQGVEFFKSRQQLEVIMGKVDLIRRFLCTLGVSNEFLLSHLDRRNEKYY